MNRSMKAFAILALFLLNDLVLVGGLAPRARAGEGEGLGSGPWTRSGSTVRTTTAGDLVGVGAGTTNVTGFGAGTGIVTVKDNGAVTAQGGVVELVSAVSAPGGIAQLANVIVYKGSNNVAQVGFYTDGAGNSDAGMIGFGVRRHGSPVSPNWCMRDDDSLIGNGGAFLGWCAGTDARTGATVGGFSYGLSSGHVYCGSSLRDDTGTLHVGALAGHGSVIDTTSSQFKLVAGTTGSGSASLSNNCPAVTATAPYTWLKFTSSDGSQVYVPAWK